MQNIIRLNGVRIDAIYACVPGNIVDNEEALKRICDEKETKNIVKTTGILKRAVASPGVSTVDLGMTCAKQMLEDGVFRKEEIGAVIFVTYTPERLLPFNAARIQAELELEKDIVAFDINLACSGYAYGLWIASTIAKQIDKKVMLFDGDIQTAYLSGLDKSTLPVMADSTTVTLVSQSQDSEEWVFSFYTDGSKGDVLSIKAGGSKEPMSEDSLVMNKYEDGSQRRDIDIYMDGFEVFKFVAIDVSSFLKDLIDSTLKTADEIDAFVPHQANIYMIKQLAKKLGTSWDKTWRSGNVVGNSGSATVPVTIAYNAKDLLVKETSKVLISGFGGGLSASAGIITLDKNAEYKMIYMEDNNK